VNDGLSYNNVRAEMIRLITMAAGKDGRPRMDRLVLNNKEAAALLKMAPAKVSQIPLEELPRRGGKGRGGVKITVVALVDYLLKEAGFDLEEMRSNHAGSVSGV